MIDDDPGWTAFPAEDPPGTDGRAVAAGAGGSRNGGDCAEGVSPGAAWRVARRRSLRLVGVIAFCEAVEYTLVVPTLFGYVAKYGATPSEYAACFSAFSIATTLVRIPFGALAMRRGYKAGYRLSIGVAVLGNVVYAVAPLAATPSWSLRLIFAGRFLAGFLGASQSLMNGYVTEAAQSKGPGETVAALSTFNLIKMIGMTAGPIFTIILAQIRFNIGPLTVDKRNAPGAAMSVILTTLLAATHCLAEPKQASPLLSRDVSDALEAGDPWRRAAAQGVAVSSLFLLFFVIGVLEAALAPVAQQVGLSTSQTSFIIGGLTALVVASGLSMNACLRRGLATEHALLCGNVAVAGAAAALGLLCATKGFGLLHFVLPLALFELSFPLLNAPARGLVHAYSRGAAAQTQGFLGFVSGLGQMAGPYYFAATFDGGLRRTAEGLFLAAVSLAAVHMVVFSRGAFSNFAQATPTSSVGAPRSRFGTVVRAPMGLHDAFSYVEIPRRPPARASLATTQRSPLLGPAWAQAAWTVDETRPQAEATF